MLPNGILDIPQFLIDPPESVNKTVIDLAFQALANRLKQLKLFHNVQKSSPA